MTQRIWCLNGNNITFDSDLTMASLATLEPWIIEGLEVTSDWINPWKALIKAIRSGWQEILLTYENTEKITSINTTGTKKIFIEIDQNKINSGEENAEDGSGIAEIKSSSDYPETNYIPLAVISNSVITDERILIRIKENILNQSDLWEVTKMWSEFNTADKLVKLESDWKLPALDGSNITNIQSSVPNSTKEQKWIVQQHSDSEAIAWEVDNKYLSAKQLNNVFENKWLDWKLVSTTTWSNESTKKTLSWLTFNNNILRKIEIIRNWVWNSYINLSVNNETSGNRNYSYFYSQNPANTSNFYVRENLKDKLRLLYLRSYQAYYELYNIWNKYIWTWSFFDNSLLRWTSWATPSSIQIEPESSVSMIVKVYEKTIN